VVGLAHKFAFESPQVTAEAVSALVMPELAQHYGVFGTPHLVLNGRRHLKGRVQEEQLLSAIRLMAAP
jgi:hypothetical protein